MTCKEGLPYTSICSSESHYYEDYKIFQKKITEKHQEETNFSLLEVLNENNVYFLYFPRQTWTAIMTISPDCACYCFIYKKQGHKSI